MGKRELYIQERSEGGKAQRKRGREERRANESACKWRWLLDIAKAREIAVACS